MFIATYIAERAIEEGHLRWARELLDEAGCRPGAPAWLEPESAFDLPFAGLDDPAASIAAARAALDGCFETFDLVVQSAAHRRKKLLAADMDSTMIAVECIDELADYAGLKAEVAAVTEAAMRGEVDFETALDARVALLEGLDEGVIDRCREERVTLMPGARTLVATMRAHGAFTLLVSGGFSRFAAPVAEAIGFDAAAANELGIAQGRLTGTVAKPIVGAEGKRKAMTEAAAVRGVSLADVLAIGDGANDLLMIEAAGLGIAFRAKPAVAAAADARIDHGDLTALLYAQGYGRSEWVEA